MKIMSPDPLPPSPPARLARAVVALLLLVPLVSAPGCGPSEPGEDAPVTAEPDAAGEPGADPAAGDMGGDELRPATPSRPDTGLDDDVETAPPEGAPEEGTAAVPAGFEDTVQQPQGQPGEAPAPTPDEPVVLTSVWVHLLSPGEDGEGGEAAADDAGVLAREAGEVIGCGDVVVAVALPVEAEVVGPEDRVRVALEALFGLGREAVPADLTNALDRSSLELDRVEPVPGRAGVYRVHLRGDLRMGGVCDAPRVRAQIEGTAERAEGVEEVQVFLDGEPLDALLSAQG